MLACNLNFLFNKPERAIFCLFVINDKYFGMIYLWMTQGWNFLKSLSRYGLNKQLLKSRHNKARNPQFHHCSTRAGKIHILQACLAFYSHKTQNIHALENKGVSF